jgi:hypothetical protein
MEDATSLAAAMRAEVRQGNTGTGPEDCRCRLQKYRRRGRKAALDALVGRSNVYAHTVP